MKPTFNVNNEVQIRPTERGWKILEEHHRDYPAAFASIRANAVDGWITEQLWKIMSIFGPHIYNGCVIPFQDNDIRFLNMISLTYQFIAEPLPDPRLDDLIARLREQLTILKLDYERHAQPIIDEIVKLEKQRCGYVIVRAPSLHPREA